MGYGTQTNREQSRRGMAYEATLRDYHKLLKVTGRAEIHKTPIDIQVLERERDRTGKPTGFVRGRLNRRLGVDWVGCLRGGRAVFAESKECSGPRFPLSTVKPHQLTFLHSKAKLGAVSLLLILQKSEGFQAQYCVPVIDLKRLQQGRKSIRWTVLEDEGYRVPPGGGWLEWLEARAR